MSRSSRSGCALALAVILTATPALSAQRDIPRSAHRRDLIGRQFDARVVRVGDGDTFDVQLNGESQRLRIRLEGVDAPEQDEVFGRESTAFLRKLLVNQSVRINGRDMDRYGRLVARVTVQGQDASTVLIRAGLACHAYARDAALAREESNARAAGAGFWGKPAPRPRCSERRTKT
jgi:endonuclease YncB( thermonuclease family)